MTNPQLFTNIHVFDGSGSARFPGEVLVTGNKIQAVASGTNKIERQSAMEIIDGDGGTLMPGLVEAHSHITYNNMARLRDLGELAPEENLLLAIDNGKLMLDSGFTSLYSAASAKLRTEVVMRNAINAGKLVGPRLRAASPELSSTGGLGDVRQVHMQHQSFEWIADGVEQVRLAVRTFIREGVDNVKVNISGDNFVRPNFGKALGYTEGEVAAAAEEAHARGAWLVCHARADGAVRLALKYGFRVINHCDFVEGETFDLLEAKKDSIFLVPAIGVIYATAYEGGGYGITPEVSQYLGMPEMLEAFPRVYGELWKRGLRILPGGDYGFAWNPIGNDARDLEHFVNMLGLTPAQALMTATKWGGEIMGLDVGLVKEGFLADLILVRGDPTQNIKLFQDRDNITTVMKDGVFYKRPAVKA
jgi:imidazolonepropionase-like amidohydrolase